MDGEFTDSSVDMPAQKRAHHQNIKTQVVSPGLVTNTTEFLRRRYEEIRTRINPLHLEGTWDVLVVAYHSGASPVMLRLRAQSEPACFVVGRHTECALPIESDPVLSLRHTLLIASQNSSRGVVLRVLDLSSSCGMLMVDGQPERSIATNGSLAVRIGNTALFIIYRSELSLGRLVPYHAVPTAAPERTTQHKPVEAELEHKRSVSPLKSSVLTMSDIEGDGSPRRLELTFEAKGRRARIFVTQTRLRSGCLIGRDPRCHISANEISFGEAVSRLHCLLIEVDGRPTLFDLASTNGTLVADRPIDRIVIPQSGALPVKLAEHGHLMVVRPIPT